MNVMKELYQSGAFEEINGNRLDSLDATLAVVSTPQKMPPKPSN